MQDLRLGPLPFLAEKRIALASTGSWHQPGGQHEGGTRGVGSERGEQDQRRHRTGRVGLAGALIWAAELSCAVLARWARCNTIRALPQA